MIRVTYVRAVVINQSINQQSIKRSELSSANGTLTAFAMPTCGVLKLYVCPNWQAI